MDKTNVERQRRWRERRQQDHKALLEKLATLEARVAELEAALAGRPPVATRKPPGHQQDAALKRERDALAERLARVEAYQPGITMKAKTWVEQVDAPPRRRR